MLSSLQLNQWLFSCAAIFGAASGLCAAYADSSPSESQESIQSIAKEEQRSVPAWVTCTRKIRVNQVEALEGSSVGKDEVLPGKERFWRTGVAYFDVIEDGKKPNPEIGSGQIFLDELSMDMGHQKDKAWLKVGFVHQTPLRITFKSPSCEGYQILLQQDLVEVKVLFEE